MEPVQFLWGSALFCFLLFKMAHAQNKRTQCSSNDLWKFLFFIFIFFWFKDLPSGSQQGQGFWILVHIWAHDHQSAGLHLVPSQHLSEQQPSSPSGGLSPRQQETPPLQAQLPRSAPPARTAMETGRGCTRLLLHRKCESLFWNEKKWRLKLVCNFLCGFSWQKKN